MMTMTGMVKDRQMDPGGAAMTATGETEVPEVAGGPPGTIGPRVGDQTGKPVLGPATETVTADGAQTGEMAMDTTDGG